MSTEFNRITKQIQVRDTSYEAYLNSKDIRRKSQRLIIKTMLFLNKEVTGKDIAKESGLSYTEVMRRMSELENLKHVEMTGKKRIGRNSYQTYKLTELTQNIV